MARVLGADPDSAAAWLREAVSASWGHDLAELPRHIRQVAFQRASGVVLALEDHPDDLAFALDQRTIVAAVFARYFKGVALDGPPWRLSPNEQRPTFDQWTSSLSDF